LASSDTTTDSASSSSFDDTSTDPFVILGLDAPTADTKVIKRAYKRRALKFHPDVVTTQDSTPQEKKAASDRFAKINWAYQTLTGKREAGDKTYGGGSSTTSGPASGSSWSPPHRRSSGYNSSTADSSSSWPGTTDWRDFMPKYEDDKEYNADGDSFGKIFSDLFAGAAYGAAGVAGSSAGLLMDFIEFLEGNVDGYGSGSSSGGFSSRGSDDYDAKLQVLLRTGSLDDVANEMDDTNLVVDQLQSKARSIDDEILTTNAEAKMASRYMEKIELEERVAELKARKGVIDGYLKKSRKRLLSLQTRYKELISYGGANDSYAGGGRRTSSSRSTSTGPSSPSSSTSSSSSYGQSSSPSSSNPGGTGVDEKNSWKTEGFGSSSSPRGSRGSARRRARRSSSSAEPTSSSSTTTSPSPPPPRQESTYSSTSSSYSRESVRPPPRSTSNPTPAISSSSSSSNVPPHRRTSSNYESSAEENKRRMREIQVDEEFEKLKRELGL
jgi:curved DNA-binding protein CbpA